MADRRRIPVIIDTDPGVDDVLAILLALASPELEILAIIVSFGNTDIMSSYLNIFKIYQALSRHLQLHPEDQTRFPNFSTARKPVLIVGSSSPLEGGVHYAQYFHGRDGLGEITERHPELNVDPKDPMFNEYLQIPNRLGVAVARDLIETQPERSITYIALGPLTNLASLMRLDTEMMRSRLGRIVCMGGALDVPGNTSPVAEFNFFADPYAVKELLFPTDPDQGLPLDRFILLPLDITTPHELSFPYYTKMVDPAFESTLKPSEPLGKSPICHFTSSFFERTREIMLQFGKDAMELHDIVAVWCAIENPPVTSETDSTLPTMSTGWEVRERVFDIERMGEITRGMLVLDRRDDQSAYSPGANRAEVQAELEKHQFHHAVYESTALPAQVEIAHPSDTQTGRQGVTCVDLTPGPEVLVRLLMHRVWGAN